jgi:hypothetical protein
LLSWTVGFFKKWIITMSHRHRLGNYLQFSDGIDVRFRESNT